MTWRFCANARREAADFDFVAQEKRNVSRSLRNVLCVERVAYERRNKGSRIPREGDNHAASKTRVFWSTASVPFGQSPCAPASEQFHPSSSRMVPARRPVGHQDYQPSPTEARGYGTWSGRASQKRCRPSPGGTAKRIGDSPLERVPHGTRSPPVNRGPVGAGKGEGGNKVQMSLLLSLVRAPGDGSVCCEHSPACVTCFLFAETHHSEGPRRTSVKNAG